MKSLSKLLTLAWSLVVTCSLASIVSESLAASFSVVFGALALLSLLIPTSNDLLCLKVLWGAGVVDGRGKLNGWVFAKNKAGGYARTKVSPVNPQTSYQMNVRSSFGSLSQQWKGLTPVQRDGWNALAASTPYSDIFANQRYISGLSFFVKLNQNLNTVGATNITDAPSLTGVRSVQNPEMLIDTAVPDAILNWYDGNVPANHKMVVSIAVNFSPGKKFVKNMPRIVVNLNSGLASGEDVYGKIVERLGTPIAGRNSVVMCYYINTLTGEAGIASTSSTRLIV